MKFYQNHNLKKAICILLLVSVIVPSFTACGNAESSVPEEQHETVTPSPALELEENIISDETSSAAETPQAEETAEIEETVEAQPEESPAVDITQDDGLDATQRNSLNMLNYITVLTQQINDSKGSRLLIEEVYSSLINNTYPNAVDARTQEQMTSILDTLESYRMIDVKRERLEYIYQQNCAQAYRQAIPSPMEILNIVQSDNYLKVAVSVINMAVDSYSSYSAYKDQAELEYLQDGWELDDEAAAELHNSRKLVFDYMVSMVRDNDLPGDYTLNENAVENFVSWTNSTNVIRRIELLESNRETYQAFGTYWLVLAKSYYENEDYSKCLEAISEYESITTRIFRKDYDYAEVLPMVIIAAREVCSQEEYVKIADTYAETIVNNTDIDDWSLRYFVAQVDLNLYALTQDEKYLQSAYERAKENVNILVDSQNEMNEAFISDIVQIEVPDEASKETKEEIKQYNKMLKERREKELPPISEALYLNCDLLFAVAEELQISDDEKTIVDRILHENGESLFLVKPLDEKFRYTSNTTGTGADDVDITFEGDKITLPAVFVSDDATLKVTVSSGGKKTVMDDWEIKEVNRPKNADYTEFTATYTSETGKKYTFSEGDTVEIEISPVADAVETYAFTFKAVSAKKAIVLNGIAFERM